MRVQGLFKRLLHDVTGATVVEYGLLIGTLAIAGIFGMQAFCNQLIVLWQIVDGYTSNSMAKN
jgi:Flp pilus assembly pilin Flp